MFKILILTEVSIPRLWTVHFPRIRQQKTYKDSKAFSSYEKTESIKYAICLKIQLSLGRNSAWRAFCRLGLMINCVSTFLIAGCPIWNTSTKYYNYKTINNIIKHELELEKKMLLENLKEKTDTCEAQRSEISKKFSQTFCEKKPIPCVGSGRFFRRHCQIPWQRRAAEQDKPKKRFIRKFLKWFDVTSLPKNLDTKPVIYLEWGKKWETRFMYKEV